MLDVSRSRVSFLTMCVFFFFFFHFSNFICSLGASVRLIACDTLAALYADNLHEFQASSIVLKLFLLLCPILFSLPHAVGKAENNPEQFAKCLRDYREKGKGRGEQGAGVTAH